MRSNPSVITRFSVHLALWILLVSGISLASEPKLESFPIEINGKEITIESGMKFDTVETVLQRVIKEKPTAMASTDRIQYDVQLVPDQAPVSLVFDFDKSGTLIEVNIDAYMKQQNPPVQKLIDWLNKHAGKANSRKKSQRTEMVWR